MIEKDKEDFYRDTNSHRLKPYTFAIRYSQNTSQKLQKSMPLPTLDDNRKGKKPVYSRVGKGVKGSLTPKPLTEPHVNLSIHTALVIQSVGLNS